MSSGVIFRFAFIDKGSGSSRQDLYLIVLLSLLCEARRGAVEEEGKSRAGYECSNVDILVLILSLRTHEERKVRGRSMALPN